MEPGERRYVGTPTGPWPGPVRGGGKGEEQEEADNMGGGAWEGWEGEGKEN